MRYLTCFFKNYRHKNDRWNATLASFFCTFAILWEPPHRRLELTLYLFPRFIDALWTFLEKRGLIKSLPNGEVLIFAIAMGIIMFCYQTE